MNTTNGLVAASEPNADIQPEPSVSNNQLPPNPSPPNPPLPLPLPRQLRSASSFIQPTQRPNLPNGSLLSRREDYIKICIPLYTASISGDWKAANLLLSPRPELVQFSITENHETALHIAVSAQKTKFVEQLVRIMSPADLELQNENGNTALILAAVAGNKRLAEILVIKNPQLLTILNTRKVMPLYMAALFGNHDTVKYLYDNSEKMTGDKWNSQNRGWVLLKCIEADLFDIALRILEDCVNPVEFTKLARTNGVLGVLARKPYAFSNRDPVFFSTTIKSFFGVHVKQKESNATKLLHIIWKNVMLMCKDDINILLRGPPMKDANENVIMRGENPTYSSRVLFVAAEMGNTNFLVELIRQYPDLIWKVDDNDQSIFHIAVSHRHESIYNLLHEIGSMKDLIILRKDPQGNNMLHLVGKNAYTNRLQDISGDAFQMQWELLWFKEVEAIMPRSYRERKNKDGKTPRELFTENHKDLVIRGEKWMKATANQCMVVAALIATIVFAVAFSIPGGYDQMTGFPMFMKREIFIAFVISDAISLVFSSASILIFLSIVTSRYDEQEFFESLPQKLMIGLATLFISIVTMMVAFSFSFFVLYHNKLIWVPILISVVASVPVILYAKLQFALLKDVHHSIYSSRYMFKPKKRMLYIQNPRF